MNYFDYAQMIEEYPWETDELVDLVRQMPAIEEWLREYQPETLEEVERCRLIMDLGGVE